MNTQIYKYEHKFYNTIERHGLSNHSEFEEFSDFIEISKIILDDALETIQIIFFKNISSASSKIFHYYAILMNHQNYYFLILNKINNIIWHAPSTCVINNNTLNSQTTESFKFPLKIQLIIISKLSKPLFNSIHHVRHV